MQNITKEERTAIRCFLAVVIFYGLVSVLAGCASDDWTSRDTLAEITWQSLNVIDAHQTAHITRNGLMEVDPLTVRIIGQYPSSSDAYQLMLVYSIGHYLISRNLPAKYRKWWHIGTVAPKATVVFNNYQLTNYQ